MNFPGDIWPRLSYSGLTAGPRQAVFDCVHGLVRNRARLFQQGRVGYKCCLDCPRTIPLRPPKSDLEHLACVKVRDAWQFVRGLVNRHQPNSRGRRTES